VGGGKGQRGEQIFKNHSRNVFQGHRVRSDVGSRETSSIGVLNMIKSGYGGKNSHETGSACLTFPKVRGEGGTKNDSMIETILGEMKKPEAEDRYKIDRKQLREDDVGGVVSALLRAEEGANGLKA